MDHGAKQSISGGGGGLKLMSTGSQHLIPATDASCKCSLILWIFSLKCASFWVWSETHSHEIMRNILVCGKMIIFLFGVCVWEDHQQPLWVYFSFFNFLKLFESLCRCTRSSSTEKVRGPNWYSSTASKAILWGNFTIATEPNPTHYKWVRDFRWRRSWNGAWSKHEQPWWRKAGQEVG